MGRPFGAGSFIFILEASKSLQRPEAPVPTLTIDGREYDSEQLSKAAQAQVKNLQIVGQKIAQVQQELATMQTARSAYAQALHLTIHQL